MWSQDLPGPDWVRTLVEAGRSKVSENRQRVLIDSSGELQTARRNLKISNAMSLLYSCDAERGERTRGSR
jgi:hypothetical protein